FVRHFLRHLMEDACLGGNYVRVVTVVLNEVDHPGSGTDVMCDVHDVSFRLRVCDNLRTGMLPLQCKQLINRKCLVDDASTIPQQHIATRFADQVSSEVFIRCENDWLLRRY